MYKTFSLFTISFLGLLSTLCYATPLWDSNLYHQHHAPQLVTASELLKGMTIDKTADILDVGCGTGDITAYLALQAPSGITLGIDAFPAMISFAQAHYAGIPHISFKQLDARMLPLENYQFDYVFSFSCLHWIDDTPAVMRGVALNLKPGGYFLAALAHKDHFLYKHVKSIAQSAEWSQYFKNPAQEPWYAHTPESFEKILTDAGLKPLTVTAWYKHNSFKDKQAFKKFIDGWITAVPHVQQLPEELQDCFISRVIESFLETCTFQEDGSFNFISPVLLVKAQKQ